MILGLFTFGSKAHIALSEAVRHILSLGNRIWVEEPEALRKVIYDRARAVVDHIETFGTQDTREAIDVDS